MIGFLLLLLIAATPFIWEATRKPVSKRRDAMPGTLLDLRRGHTHVQIRGPLDGKPFVLVHGLTTPSYVFDGLVEALIADGFRVITYDHYGRGYSDRPHGIQDAVFFRSHLTRILDALGISEPVTLLGYSMGGAIATDYAARHPERITRLILIAPAGMRADLGGFVRRAVALPLIGDWLMHVLYPRLHIKGTEAERHLPSAVPGIVDLQQEELAYRGFIRSVLSSLRGILRRQLKREHEAIADSGIPTLAIWGEHDEIIPLSGRDDMAAWNPTARHIIVPDSGHGLTYTHAEKVIEAIRS